MGRPSKYPEEFRKAAVELVRTSGRPLADVARELGINDTTLGNWVAGDRKRRGEQPDLSESERAELVRLRRETAQLRMEKEILKKAAAFFVTESTK